MTTTASPDLTNDLAPPHTPAAVSGAPRKLDLFGVHVSDVGPGQVVEHIMRWAIEGQPAIVNFMPVHGLIEARRGNRREAMNQFDIVACDGQPVRWALNRFHNAGIDERVYGPTCMQEVCAQSARAGVGVYLYGSSPEVIDTLSRVLPERFPGLAIVGAESPPYRALSAAEEADVIERVNDSGAGVLFIGIGCPKQEEFAYKHRNQIQAVQMCVGAAFDFHAGKLDMAPAWMQRRGLEWLYRLYKEPGRLWKRYLKTNSIFAGLFIRRLLVGR